MSRGKGLVTGRDIRYGMDRKTLAADREAQLEKHGRQFCRKVGQFARSEQDNSRMEGRNMCVSGTEKDDRLSQVWRSMGKHRIPGGWRYSCSVFVWEHTDIPISRVPELGGGMHGCCRFLSCVTDRNKRTNCGKALKVCKSCTAEDRAAGDGLMGAA